MDTKRIIDELEAERGRLDAAIAALHDGAKRPARDIGFQQRPGNGSVWRKRRDGLHGREPARKPDVYADRSSSSSSSPKVGKREPNLPGRKRPSKS